MHWREYPALVSTIWPEVMGYDVRRHGPVRNETGADGLKYVRYIAGIFSVFSVKSVYDYT